MSMTTSKLIYDIKPPKKECQINIKYAFGTLNYDLEEESNRTIDLRPHAWELGYEKRKDTIIKIHCQEEKN